MMIETESAIFKGCYKSFHCSCAFSTTTYTAILTTETREVSGQKQKRGITE